MEDCGDPDDEDEPTDVSDLKQKGKATKETDADGEVRKSATASKKTATVGKKAATTKKKLATGKREATAPKAVITADAATTGKAATGGGKPKKVKDSPALDAPKATPLPAATGPTDSTANDIAMSTDQEDSAQVARGSRADSRPLATAPLTIMPFVFPPTPTNITELPSTIQKLELLLPKFNVTMAVDCVEDELEDAIAGLALEFRPNMSLYLEKNLALLEAHRNAITEDDDENILIKLEQRDEALRWYLTHYRLLASAMDAEIVVDPIFGAFDEMDVDPEPVPLRE